MVDAVTTSAAAGRITGGTKAWIASGRPTNTG